MISEHLTESKVFLQDTQDCVYLTHYILNRGMLLQPRQPHSQYKNGQPLKPIPTYILPILSSLL